MPAALARAERPTTPTAGGGAAGPVGRAAQETEYGRRGKGYGFGAFEPADGDALAAPYAGRAAADYVGFLARVEARLPPDVERIYAVVDDLRAHRAADVPLFALAHPRWEVVFPPEDAAYLTRIAPWWRVLRSLALKGRRVETWAGGCEAVQDATVPWTAHRHPLSRGQRRRHRPRPRPGIGLPPKAA
jgi:hypothetical protein